MDLVKNLIARASALWLSIAIPEGAVYFIGGVVIATVFTYLIVKLYECRREKAGQ